MNSFFLNVSGQRFAGHFFKKTADVIFAVVYFCGKFSKSKIIA